MTQQIPPFLTPLAKQPRHVCVIAPCERSAARWCRRQGLTRRMWTFCYGSADLTALRDVHVVWLGAVWTRPDFGVLCDLVDAMVREGLAVVDRREIPGLRASRRG